MATSIAAIHRKVQKKFKMRGLTLKVDSLDEILSFLSHFPDAEEEALDLLADEIDNESLKSSILDKDSVHKVVSRLIESDQAVNPDHGISGPGAKTAALRIIDAFLMPKFRHDPIRKKFYEHTEKLEIYGEASAKANLYRDRFQLLLQSISRDKNFSKPTFDAVTTDGESSEITPIQSLVGCVGKKWIMGVISQLEDDHFFLEDLTAAVPIDISNAKITTGFFVENTIIVAEGEMLINGTFQVDTCGFPPLEERETSLSLLMGLDFFGSGIYSAEEINRLSELEKKAVNDMFVVLSDVWLDDAKTVEKLGIVLNGFNNEDSVPSLFVFMGNFCSRPCNLSYKSYSDLRSCFGKLGEIINACEKLKEQSRFLFIPGPDDAGPSSALPKCALPDYLTEEIRKHIPLAVFSSNPCRVKFYTQEIVFLRQDLLYRMQRSCLIPPSSAETMDSFEHLVATITHQSHLCPLPLTVQPIVWNYDHCLRLYPTPDAIVLGDRSEQKAFNYTGVAYFNPGSFSNDSSFVVYRPCSQVVELSSL